jgi:hypothetical protein
MGGPHNKSIYKWIFIINHPFSGTPIYGDLYIFPFLGPKKCSLSPVVPVPTKLAALALMVLQVEHPRSVAVL